MSASYNSLSKHPVALVVESNPSLRRLTSTILRQTGYLVYESRTHRYQGMVEEWEGSLQMLVVGMNLAGGVNGLEVANKVWRKNPAVRIIVTGDSNPTEQEMRVVREANMTFLSLPYSFGRLSQAASVVTEAV